MRFGKTGSKSKLDYNEKPGSASSLLDDTRLALLKTMLTFCMKVDQTTTGTYFYITKGRERSGRYNLLKDQCEALLARKARCFP